MYAGGERRPNGGGGGGEGEALRRRRLPPGPGLGLGLSSSSPGAGAGAAASSSTSYSSSSSGRGEEEGEDRGGGGKKQQGRRKKKQGRREAVARAIRAGLPGACWGGGAGVSVVQEAGSGRRWSRSRRERDGDASDDGSGPVAATAGPAAAAWCCVCPGGDCSLEPNPSANGKEEPGVRSLLEGNDFFSADCNPHDDDAAALDSS